MNRFILLLAVSFFFSLFANAQVSGNRQQETRFLDLPAFTELEVHLPANMLIDCQGQSRIEITTDANLFDYLEVENQNGRLILSQKEAVSPSKGILISLGAKEMRKLTTSASASIQVVGLDREYFQLVNPAATVLLEGKTDELRLAIESGQVEASRMKTLRLFAKIWSNGIATVNATESIEADVSNGGKLIYHGQPQNLTQKTSNGGLILAVEHGKKTVAATEPRTDGKVRFAVVNRTGAYINTFIEGPGSNPFGYGRPFKDGQARPEELPAGTKFYLEDERGGRTLLFVVQTDDEGGVVELVGG